MVFAILLLLRYYVKVIEHGEFCLHGRRELINKGRMNEMANEVNDPIKNREKSSTRKDAGTDRTKKTVSEGKNRTSRPVETNPSEASRKKAASAQGAKSTSNAPKKSSKSAKARRRKINRYVRIIGRIMLFLQVLFSMVLMLRLVGTKMFPARYITMATIVVVVFGVIALALHLKKNRNVRIAGIVVSLLVTIFCLYGNSYVSRTLRLLSGGEESYKTDSMVVSVRADDAAEQIADAKDYTFGVYYSDDSDDNSARQAVNDIQKQVKQEISVVEYDSDVLAAQALIDGDVDAVLYSNAVIAVIDDVIDDYSEQVKNIYSFDVKTDLEQESADAGESFNLLISGIDVYGDISQTSRSDVNIIMTINPTTKKILLTSTPRDYYVTIPGVSGESRDKLTHAGIYGVDASMAALENLYGIDITYYVRVNFNTLIDLVNALGGIDVYVEYAFDAYTDDYYFDKGWHHMDGDEALAFCRERYSFTDGDNQRGKDQEQVLKAILEKAMSPAVLYNASELLESLDGSFQTNMTEDKIAELINMQLSDNASWDIYRQTAEQGVSELLPTYSGGSTPLYVTWPEEDSVKRGKVRIDMFLNGEIEQDLLDSIVSSAASSAE